MKWRLSKVSKWSWSFLKSRAFWWRTAATVAAIFILLAIAGAPILPGNPLYPVKRAGEAVLTALAPSVSYQHVNFKEGVRAIYAARRLNEAAAMVERLDKRSVKKQVSDADTIEALLQQFDQVFSDLSLTLSQQIDRGEQPSEKIFTNLQKRSTELYVKLVHLRLEAPSTNQATILRSIVIINANLATMADTLHQAPVSKDDAVELTKLVTSGLISKADLTALLDQANSNRRLLELLRERVKSGQLPSGIIYAMNFDLVSRLLPDEAEAAIHSVRFDELRKVALLMKAVEPTPSQKQAIEQYLKSYKVGDLVPTNSLTRYTAPLVYGLHLVETIGVDTSAIEAEHLSPERRIFYELWAPMLGTAKSQAQSEEPLEVIAPRVLAQTDSNQTTETPRYDQVLEAARVGLIKSSALLDRVQLELLKALRSEVAYMALPPGWTATDITAMSEPFQQLIEALRVAETVQTKTNQAVDTLSAVIQPLQEGLSSNEANTLRVEMATAIEALRTQLVQNVYNSTFTTVNNTTVVNRTEVSIDDDLAALLEKFNQSLSDLEDKLPKDEREALREAFEASLSALKESQASLEDQVSAQAQLITGTKTAIGQLQTDQSALAGEISIARQEAVDLSKTSAAKVDAAIATLQQTQSSNVADLQSQLNDQVTRAGALELSLVSLSQAQLEQRQALEREIAKLQANTAEDALSRAELEQSITDLMATQAASSHNLAEAILALGSQLTQSIAGIAAAQSQTQANLELVETKTVSLEAAMTGISQVNLEAQANLEAEIAETKVIQDALTQSFAALEQAQALTAAEVATLRGDVGQLKRSITDINDTQLAAQAQIDSLLAASVDWSNLAASVEIDLAALQELQVNLEADFAAKSAQLQEQFESYQEQLNDGINRLNSTADEQILRLQQEADRLKLELQQLQQTTPTTPPTTTPGL